MGWSETLYRFGRGGGSNLMLLMSRCDVMMVRRRDGMKTAGDNSDAESDNDTGNMRRIITVAGSEALCHQGGPPTIGRSRGTPFRVVPNSYLGNVIT